MQEEKGDTQMEKNQPVVTFDGLNMSSTLQLTGDAFHEKTAKETYTKEDVYDPFKNRDKALATSSTGALLHMLKSSLGTGILAMPNAFKNGGLIYGAFGTFLTGLICTHCIHMLVHCSQVLSRRVKQPTLSFAETAEAAFKTGPTKYRFLSTLAREFVHAALFATYFFGPSVYIVFISRSFEQVFGSYFQLEWKIRVYILVLSTVLLPMGLVRTMKYLVPFSALATVFIMFGMTLTLYYIFSEIPDVSTRHFIGEPLKLPLFFSTVLYAMEGIGIVLPIENAMKHPEHFLGCFGVLNAAMAVVVVLYTTVGFFGYLRFGSETNATITLNLPDNLLAEAVKILVALSTLFTFGLQFTVPAEIVWKHLSPKISKANQEMGYYIMRGIMISGTVVVALVLPSLSPFISLVGAICFSILGLFCPAVVEIITFWEEGYGRFQWRLYKDLLLILISVFSLVSGSYASTLEIIETFQNQEI